MLTLCTKRSDKIKLMRLVLLFTSFVFLMSSCTKVEGPGGSSSIIGKVHAEVYDGANNLINEYDIAKEDVYLIYGEDGTFYDDDVETSYDGTFRFDYLERGNYQLFVYSKCNTCPSGKEVILVDVEISNKKSTVDVGTITIRK